MSDTNAFGDGERPEAAAAVFACTDCLDPAEAFSRVANETRLSILQALWAADERPMAFSTLRRAVGMRDSAQFNYHLQQLEGHFVVRTDDGYDFRYAGEKVVRAVIAGSFNERPTLEPFRVEGRCVACDGPLEARYGDEHLAITCLACGHGHGEYPFPPGGLNDRSSAEIADAFDQRVRHLYCLAADGVCPECAGRVETTVVEAGEECCLGASVRVDLKCVQCGHTQCGAPGIRLLDHSAVVNFHRERGVALEGRPYWTFPWTVSDAYTEVTSRDPWRIVVRMPLEGDELRVTMTDDLDVVETRVVRDEDGSVGE